MPWVTLESEQLGAGKAVGDVRLPLDESVKPPGAVWNDGDRYGPYPGSPAPVGGVGCQAQLHPTLPLVETVRPATGGRLSRLARVRQPEGGHGEECQELAIRSREMNAERPLVESRDPHKLVAGVARTQSGHKAGQRAGGRWGQHPSPVRDSILRPDLGTGLVMRGAEMKGIGATAVTQIPALGEAGYRARPGVEPSQAFEDFTANRERGRIVDERRIERLGVLSLQDGKAGDRPRTRRPPGCRGRWTIAGHRRQHQHQRDPSPGAPRHFWILARCFFGEW